MKKTTKVEWSIEWLVGKSWNHFQAATSHNNAILKSNTFNKEYPNALMRIVATTTTTTIRRKVMK